MKAFAAKQQIDRFNNAVCIGDTIVAVVAGQPRTVEVKGKAQTSNGEAVFYSSLGRLAVGAWRPDTKIENPQ